ncbi:MAG: hypothetical protein OEY10_00210 [Nitrosopumilus sp.]|nr:hypothetical protein [Nitrosopumilus sp.]
MECRHSDMFSSRKAAFDSLYSTLILRAEEATVYDADTTLELTNN